ncbi:hypothetical protein A4A49_55743, partial [Nicotiana attenuata]
DNRKKLKKYVKSVVKEINDKLDVVVKFIKDLKNHDESNENHEESSVKGNQKHEADESTEDNEESNEKHEEDKSNEKHEESSQKINDQRNYSDGENYDGDNYCDRD